MLADNRNVSNGTSIAGKNRHASGVLRLILKGRQVTRTYLAVFAKGWLTNLGNGFFFFRPRLFSFSFPSDSFHFLYSF